LATDNNATKQERYNMLHQTKKFFDAEDGAVTVDWVVLTAAVCGIAIAAFASIQQGSESVGNNVNGFLTDTSIEEIAGID
jgi:hypothetical protein